MADKENTSTVDFEGGAIGYVRLVKGHVTATAQDGTVRVLTVGDMVYPDEVIQTGPDGGVVIEFRDGAALALTGDSEALLDREVYDVTTAKEIEEQTAAIEDIQQAILAGADPTQILEAPAAGPEGGELLGDGAEEPVAIARTGQRITPQSGFETTAPQFAAEGDRQEEGVPLAETAATTSSSTDSAPVAQDHTDSALEDGGVISGTVPTATDLDGDLNPNGYVLDSNVGEGSLSFGIDGTYTFDVGSGFQDLAGGESRSVTFTYTASDLAGNTSSSATVTITVSGTEDAPVITGTASGAVVEDTTLTTGGTLSVTDADAAD
ncbi:MAG: retention module-containing protein, partial [Sedimenticola sp.]